MAGAAWDAGANEAMAKLARMSDEERVDRITWGATIGAFGGEMADRHIGNPLARAIPGHKPSGLIASEAMTRNLKRVMGVPEASHHVVPDMVVPGTASPWTGGKGAGTIYLKPGASAEIAAHELGHLKSNKNRVWRAINRHGRRLAPTVALAAGGAMALAGDEGSTTTRIAPAVAAAGFAPLLVDEAAATVRGLRALKRAGASQAAMRTARGNLIKSFSTYGVGAAASVLPVAAIAAYRGRKKSRGQGK